MFGSCMHAQTSSMLYHAVFIELYIRTCTCSTYLSQNQYYITIAFSNKNNRYHKRLSICNFLTVQFVMFHIFFIIVSCKSADNNTMLYTINCYLIKCSCSFCFTSNGEPSNTWHHMILLPSPSPWDVTLLSPVALVWSLMVLLCLVMEDDGIGDFSTLAWLCVWDLTCGPFVYLSSLSSNRGIQSANKMKYRENTNKNHNWLIIWHLQTNITW